MGDPVCTASAGQVAEARAWHAAEHKATRTPLEVRKAQIAIFTDACIHTKTFKSTRASWRRRRETARSWCNAPRPWRGTPETRRMKARSTAHGAEEEDAGGWRCPGATKVRMLNRGKRARSRRVESPLSLGGLGEAEDRGAWRQWSRERLEGALGPRVKKRPRAPHGAQRDFAPRGEHCWREAGVDGRELHAMLAPTMARTSPSISHRSLGVS